jgi:hypothetical protein
VTSASPECAADSGSTPQAEKIARAKSAKLKFCPRSQQLVPDIRASHKIVPGEPQRGPLAGFRAQAVGGVMWLPSLQHRFLAVLAYVALAQTVDHDLIHFIGDSMISISDQAIDAGSHEEMGTSVLSRAKEFIDVALAITDMIWMHRLGSSRRSVDCFRFSSHRTLSFFSMGTRV